MTMTDPEGKLIIDVFGQFTWNETKRMVDECEPEWFIVHDTFKNIVYYQNIHNSSVVKPTPYTGRHISIANSQLSPLHEYHIRLDGTDHNLTLRSYYVANRWRRKES